jgi:hypothetical protein
MSKSVCTYEYDGAQKNYLEKKAREEAQPNPKLACTPFPCIKAPNKGTQPRPG